MKREMELAFWEGESRDIATHDLKRYPLHLDLEPFALEGKKVLDVGCGPIPYATAFTGCELWGIDPLLDGYAELGYDLSHMHYVWASAERMPFLDGYFDMAISVNALDHTDDYEAVLAEMSRVAKVVRFEAHYHKPRPCEPHALSDEAIRWVFDGRKLRELPYCAFHPGCEGTVALWQSA